MVTTSHIAPHHILSAYVECYSLKEFDTDGFDLKRPWHASYHTSIAFFFRDTPIQFCDSKYGKITSLRNRIHIVGLCSEYKGEITFSGAYSYFEITLKPTGWHEIFRIPDAEIRNHIINGRDLLNFELQLLYERLCTAKDIAEMGLLADGFLLQYLFRNNEAGRCKNLSKIIETMFINKTDLNHFTYQVDMSNRNLERLFIAKLGVSPKHFICIVRFNLALCYKKQNPTTDWTSIATEYGYFDQMHMIREFKHLSGNTPSHLIKIPLIMEKKREL